MASLNSRDATPIRHAKIDKAPEKPTAPYGAIPEKVITSPVYSSLSDAAVRLLVELVRQHDGWNNGALFASYRYLAERGMKSREKVSRAFDELRAAGFIVETRRATPEQATRYALTWLPANSEMRDGTRKEMPLLPQHYPRDKYLTIAPTLKATKLKGRARMNHLARVQRDIGIDPGNKLHGTGNTDSVPPDGTAPPEKTAKMVPPSSTHSTAGRDTQYRPATHPSTALGYTVIASGPEIAVAPGVRPS